MSVKWTELSPQPKTLFAALLAFLLHSKQHIEKTMTQINTMTHTYSNACNVLAF